MSYKMALGLRALYKHLIIREKYFHTSFSSILIQNDQSKKYSTGVHVDKKEIEVYQGPLSKQILRVKFFTLMTSSSGLLAQPVIMQKATEIGSTSLIILIYSFVGFFTFVTPLLLHYVTKKYVTSVLYDPHNDSYTATTISLFLRRKELSLKPGEGTLPDVPGMFTSLTVRGIPLFIDARYFSNVYHYKRIMGFDKPIDFKLKIKSSNTIKQ